MGFEKAENSNTIYYKLNDLEKNSVLKAIYKGSFTGGDFNSTTHYFVDADGQKYGVAGCTELNRKLDLVSEDTLVALTYKGKRKLETAHGVVHAHSFWIEQEINGAMEPVIFKSGAANAEAAIEDNSGEFAGSEAQA